MFRGPRRRTPLLGAAVIVGASRSAARHEVASQNQQAAFAQQQSSAAASKAQADAERAMYEKKRMEDEQDKRTAAAIEMALAKERQGVDGNPPQYSADNANTGTAFFCGACGKQCNTTQKFCPNCGRQHVQNDFEKATY